MFYVNYPTLFTIVDEDPTDAAEGQMIFNSVDRQLKIWYAGTWNVIGDSNPPGAYANDLLLENNFHLLLESGDALLL